MPEAFYEVQSTPGGWVISHDGEVSAPYDLPEAAFEQACVAASLAVKAGLDATVTLKGQLLADNDALIGIVGGAAVEPEGTVL